MKQNDTNIYPAVRDRSLAWPKRVLLCTVLAFAFSFATPMIGVLIPTTAQAQSSAAANEALAGELFLAIENQDLNAVKSAVRKGADVEARDYTGTQPVDLAISRGFFNIAHYLISVRNAKQAALSGTPVQPAPSAEELAQSQDDAPNGSEELSELDALLGDEPTPAPPPTPAPAPVENVIEDPASVTPPPEPEIDPFSTVQAAGELPVLGEIQEPDELSDDPFSEDMLETEEPPEALTAEEEPELPIEPVEELAIETVEELDETPAEKVAEEIVEEAEETVELSIKPEDIASAEESSPAPEVSIAEAAPTPTAEKPSAFVQFFTTFGDFFKPPNVTGVIRKKREARNEDAVSDEEIALELKQLEEERGNEIIKGPAVPISPEELAKELPPLEGFEGLSEEEIAALPQDGTGLPEYSVSSPSSLGAPLPSNDDAFGDLTIVEEGDEPSPSAITAVKPGSKKVPSDEDFGDAPGVPGRKYDHSLPFGGGVDPLILDFLELSLRTAQDLTGDEDETALRELLLVDKPISFEESQNALLDEGGEDKETAADDNPFDLLDGAEEPEVSDLLEDLDGPPKSADAGASDNPFDLIKDDAPGGKGEVDELAGLLEPTGEGEGWDVKEVENANIPDQIFVLADLAPTGEPLDNIELTLGIDVGIGKELDEERLKLMAQDTIRRPCLEKGGANTIFCTDKINWPFELEEIFLVDTIMYQGTRAIARYEAGQATNYHTLFRTEAFEQVVGYYTERFGQPTTKIERAIAPLAAPRQDNPTFIWQSREAGTDTIVNLEIRKFDDAKDAGFPDTKRGVIMLYRNHAKPIFPVLSQLELMVLKTEGVETASTPSGEEGVPTENADPSSIWN